MDKREERVKAVNKIIKEIANRGRNFFFTKDKGQSYFYLDGNKRKRLWFWDNYTGKVNPYASNYHGENKISEGGTLWALIHDFREYILTGGYTNGNNGYGGLYCPHWGYPEEDMKAIIEVAKDVGFLKKQCKVRINSNI